MEESSFHFDPGMKPPARTPMGCLAKGLITIAICLVVFGVGAVLAGYYIWYHTALPAKGIVALLNQAPGIQIEGVSGSFSSGFNVKKIRIADDAGFVNSLDDIRLEYRTEGDDVVITDVHVAKGHFYIDRSKDGRKTDHSTGQQAPASKELSHSRYIFEKISINDVTVEDVSSCETFHLEKLEIEDLMLGKETSLGKLIADSTDCSIRILPVDGKKKGKVFTVSGLFKPGLHENLVQSLDVEGQIDASESGKTVVDLKLLGGKVAVEGYDRKMTMRIRDLNLADYFKDVPPLAAIDLQLTQDGDSGAAVGSFSIGGKLFAVDQKVVEVEAEQERNLVATHQSCGVTYEIRIPRMGESKKILPPMQLNTQPAMSTEDAVAQLLAGEAYGSLTDGKKAEVDKLLPYFAGQEK